MSNGESSEPSVLWLKGDALEDAKADIDVWEQVQRPSSTKKQEIRSLLDKAVADGLTDKEARKLHRIQKLAKEPREQGVQLPMQYEEGLIRLDADQVGLVQEQMARIRDFPPEYIEETERLLAKARDEGLQKPELADLEGRVMHMVRRLETARQSISPTGEDLVDSRSSRIRNAFSRARFKKGSVSLPSIREEMVEQPKSYERPGDFERKLAVSALAIEEQKVKDRIRTEQIDRVERMRTTDPRQKEEKRRRENNESISKEERVRRLNILLRAGMYDRDRTERLMKSKDDVVEVQYTHASGKDEMVKVAKSDIKNWFKSLLPHEQKRLYVIGRKRFDFKFNEKAFLVDYFKQHPGHVIKKSDTDEEKIRKQKIIDTAIENEKTFQKEQKELADALEVVALPMLRGVFKNLGKKADIYLTSSNDDIAGGLDVAIDLLKDDGTPETFFDGMPMRFVVDMTYARMRSKVKKDLARGRICSESYGILQDREKEIPWQLSNARAMKLFRTVIEALSGTMSVQTFDKDGPLEKAQEHVPRLVIGLDWENAFSAISGWVKDDNFEEKYRHTTFSRSIERSVRNQLLGLHALVARHNKDNPNIKYIDQILQTIGFKKDRLRWQRASTDSSLTNIEDLLTRDLLPRRKWAYNRFYAAAIAQVEHDAREGHHVRGDMPISLQSSAAPVRPQIHQPQREPDRMQPQTISSPQSVSDQSSPEEIADRRLAKLKLRALRTDARERGES